jgi:hypothetical protein
MVPNRCFFVFLGPMKFSLVNYLAVRSAAEINKPESLLIYYETHPEGPWWERAREYVTDLIQVDPPRFIGSFAVEHPAHQSDLVRLTCLLRDGGVYLDLDVLSVRDLSPLREFSFVIGEEGIDGREGLCNAVMLAEPGSTFVAEWLNGHDPETSRWSGFRARGHDEHWDEMSCKYPAYLAALFPGDIRSRGMTASTGRPGTRSTSSGSSGERVSSSRTPTATTCGTSRPGTST